MKQIQIYIYSMEFLRVVGILHDTTANFTAISADRDEGILDYDTIQYNAIEKAMNF